MDLVNVLQRDLLARRAQFDLEDVQVATQRDKALLEFPGRGQNVDFLALHHVLDETFDYRLGLRGLLAPLLAELGQPRYRAALDAYVTVHIILSSASPGLAELGKLTNCGHVVRLFLLFGACHTARFLRSRSKPNLILQHLLVLRCSCRRSRHADAVVRRGVTDLAICTHKALALGTLGAAGSTHEGSGQRVHTCRTSASAITATWAPPTHPHSLAAISA
mmetsp:Transcript_47514/g.110004  ORF Transcript_47514/g.110004 Transcript_47514/m.110004 type:complete len:220 (-) Transcript_47514:21-680(-)